MYAFIYIMYIYIYIVYLYVSVYINIYTCIHKYFQDFMLEVKIVFIKWFSHVKEFYRVFMRKTISNLSF